MVHVFRNKDNKRVVLNVKNDQALYVKSNIRPSGSNNWSGTDLHVHKTKNSNEEYYYLYHWSSYQDSSDSYEVLESKDAAIQYLEDYCVNDEWGFPDQNDQEILKDYGIDLLSEEA